MINVFQRTEIFYRVVVYYILTVNVLVKHALSVLFVLVEDSQVVIGEPLDLVRVADLIGPGHLHFVGADYMVQVGYALLVILLCINGNVFNAFLV